MSGNHFCLDAGNQKLVEIHAGLIPEVKGVSPIAWSIVYDVPLGVSVHVPQQHESDLGIAFSDHSNLLNLRLIRHQKSEI